MRVLVTGATGFVGRHVMHTLVGRGHLVTAVARDVDKARTMPWIDRVKFLGLDIHNSGSRLLEDIDKPDAVIHLAWPGLPNYKASFHLKENLPADCRFVETLVTAGIAQILVTGTCLEYGMKSGCLREDVPAEPNNAYALAKDALRKYLEELRRRHPFTLQWARLFYMYGLGQNPNSLIAQLDQAIDRGDPIFNMSGGEQLRDYLPVEEVARRLVLLVEHRDRGGVFNICSGEPISVRRLVERHCAERGATMKLNLGYFPYPDYEPMAFWGDTRRYDVAVGAA